MDQKEREVIMKEFRSGSSRVLITTDLLVNECLFFFIDAVFCKRNVAFMCCGSLSESLTC